MCSVPARLESSGGQVFKLRPFTCQHFSNFYLFAVRLPIDHHCKFISQIAGNVRGGASGRALPDVHVLCSQVPWVWGLTTYHKRLHLKPLAALFWGASAGYAMLVVMFVVVIATTDWAKYALEARLRSEVKAGK